MRKIEEYYKNTQNDLPHKNVLEFIDLKNKAGKAIDLGCGAGRDTICLIKNGWEVIAIDQENTKQIIGSKLNDKELERLKFIRSDFENVKFKKSNLVVANYSIPFCEKDKFYSFWNKIVNSIVKDGYFVGIFFGKNDEWNTEKSKFTFLDKKHIEELFNNFEILKFEEEEKDAKTGLGIIKHWHTYNIIARKK